MIQEKKKFMIQEIKRKNSRKARFTIKKNQLEILGNRLNLIENQLCNIFRRIFPNFKKLSKPRKDCPE